MPWPLDPAPIIYALMTLLFVIAILALRGAVLESNRTHRLEENEQENDNDVHTP